MEYLFGCPLIGVLKIAIYSICYLFCSDIFSLKNSTFTIFCLDPQDRTRSSNQPLCIQYTFNKTANV